MKKLGIFLSALMLTSAIQAQEKTSLSSRLAQKDILNHMDVGVNVGTTGIGVDVAVPVGKYVRVRAGYNYMPRFTFHSDFSLQTRKGGGIEQYLVKIQSFNIEKKAAQFGVDLSLPEFQGYKTMAEKFRNVDSRDDLVTMDLKPNLHQFKFLVDVLPFKNNKHWSFTAGFFVGSTQVGDAINQESESLLLEAVNAYNDLYKEYLGNGKNFAGHGEIAKLTQLFTDNGVAGIPLGYFADGKKAMMVPGADGTIRAEMFIKKVRPYLGFGYNTHLSRNRKWNLNVDAGIMFLCGKPNVYVNNVYAIDERAPTEFDFSYEEYFFGMPISVPLYGSNYDILHPVLNEDGKSVSYIVDQPLQHVDLMNDVHDVPGKVGDVIDKVSKFKVYPNVSVTFSYRLF